MEPPRSTFPLPDSLTTWKVKAWTLGLGTKVGQAETEIVTSKDLLVRLQAARFFVEKDEVVLSANVHNKLKKAKSVQVVLGARRQRASSRSAKAREPCRSPRARKQRVDWRVKVVHEGQAVIRMKALTDEESDAAQMSFPAYVHGMLKMEAFAGAIRPDEQKGQVVVRVPSERKPDQSRLEVHYSPTLAGALVDALPYLADYPYGCTEQTVNRFLPTVITQKILIKLGVDLKFIKEKHTNLNAQQLGDARDRAKPRRATRITRYSTRPKSPRWPPPASSGLTNMQLSDGGWGWFSGFGEYASPHTTALVVHGLANRPPERRRARRRHARKGRRLAQELSGTSRSDCSKTRPARSSRTKTPPMISTLWSSWSWPTQTFATTAMIGFLDRDRNHLSVYAKTMLGLGLERLGEKAKLAAVLQNISQYVVRDDENQTAYLKLPNEGYWWWWYGSEVETDAFYLKLLARTDPAVSWPPGWSSMFLTTASTAPTGTRPATPPSASRPSPTI